MKLFTEVLYYVVNIPVNMTANAATMQFSSSLRHRLCSLLWSSKTDSTRLESPLNWHRSSNENTAPSCVWCSCSSVLNTLCDSIIQKSYRDAGPT